MGIRDVELAGAKNNKNIRFTSNERQSTSEYDVAITEKFLDTSLSITVSPDAGTRSRIPNISPSSIRTYGRSPHLGSTNEALPLLRKYTKHFKEKI